MLTAGEALDVGLAVKVVPHGEALKASLELANTMVSRAPFALGFIKKSIHLGRGRSVKDALEIEAGLFGEVFKTEDKNEGVPRLYRAPTSKISGADSRLAIPSCLVLASQSEFSDFL